MTSTLAHTPMFDWHAAHGGRMVDFAGWSMPLQYRSIVTEHMATRTAAGVFDISHMGRLRFDGDGAAEFLDSLLTRRVGDMTSGQIRYSLMCSADGGILDDVLVYRIEDAGGVPHYWLVVNAGNRAKIVDWINGRLEGVADVEFSDLTETTAMIAVQGPAALDILRPLVKHDAAEMKYYTGCETEFASHDALLSRTGYTGEDGAELIVPAAAGEHVWSAILEQGKAAGAIAAGLGCRDTLRLEAAMPLYGHELSEQINPFQAGLGFAVNLKDRSFVGSDALARLKEDSTGSDSTGPRRIGLEMEGKRAAREHCRIFVGEQSIGKVTSGSYSPTLEKSIAMGYVAPQHVEPGTEVMIDVRGKMQAARVVKMPFYRRG